MALEIGKDPHGIASAANRFDQRAGQSLDQIKLEGLRHLLHPQVTRRVTQQDQTKLLATAATGAAPPLDLG